METIRQAAERRERAISLRDLATQDLHRLIRQARREGSSVEAIADAAGITRQAVYLILRASV